MECKYCEGKCQKAGKQSNGLQKYFCAVCKKYQQKEYSYMAYNKEIRIMIPRLVKNSVGIRGIARVLQIATATVIRLIRRIADAITKPPVVLSVQFFDKF